MSPLETPAVASRGAGGMGPYQLLQQCLEEMSGAGLLAKERAAIALGDSEPAIIAADTGSPLTRRSAPPSPEDSILVARRKGSRVGEG